VANADTSPSAADQRQAWGIVEQLAPLHAAAPPRTCGRIQTLAQARSALRIPTSAEPEVLQAWGVPSDSQLVAFPVTDEHQPHLVTEFALLRVVRRQGRKLVAHRAGQHQRLRLREKSNALWIIYGSIVQASNGTLVLESLAIAPAFAGQLSRKGDDAGRGITADILRILSPARLLSATVEQLQRDGYLLDLAAQHHGAQPMSESQRQLLDRINKGRPRQAHTSDEELAEIAKRYITHLVFGRRPLPQIALEFGITRTQARDRVHKARQRKFLGPTKPGRASPTLGPRLKKSGWKPPLAPPRDTEPSNVGCLHSKHQ